MRLARRGLVGLAVIVPLLLGVDRPPGLGDVQDVRFWSYPDYTRVVVELSRSVDHGLRVRRLPADAASKRPERLYLDLPDIWVGRRYVDGIPVKDGLMEAVRLGQNTLSRARLVIDLEHYQRHRLLTLRSPHRVVIDVYGARDAPETLRWPARKGRTHPDARLSMPLRPVQTVVVDPGHGGADPGAIGLGGIREKDVNLKLSRLLAERLRRRGFHVVLTRDDDRSLDLEERTAIAEAARGDLFVSVHTNASPRRGARGLEIYYLDKSHERHSVGVAARENGVDPADIDNLQRAMAALRVSEASVHSSRLARLVHDAIVPRIGREHAAFRDLGIKTGPFYVLFLSSMPAILLESGFVTNRADLALLSSPHFLEGLAEQVAAGMTRYRDAGPALAVGAGD